MKPDPTYTDEQADDEDWSWMDRFRAPERDDDRDDDRSLFLIGYALAAFSGAVIGAATCAAVMGFGV